jgi:hypothetical protein
MRRFGERAEGELAAALAPDDVALQEIRRPLLEKTSWHLVDGKAWMLANAMFILGGFGKAVIATLGASDLLRESVARSHDALQGNSDEGSPSDLDGGRGDLYRSDSADMMSLAPVSHCWNSPSINRNQKPFILLSVHRRQLTTSAGSSHER